MRKHLWFPSPFEPDGASNGNPSLPKPTSNLEVQFGHSQKNSERNIRSMPVSH